MNTTVKNYKQKELKVTVNFIDKDGKEHLSKAARLLAKGAVNASVENMNRKNS
ncbi:MAG: hypothetical protein A4E53_01500 [Pelotomaculum sp. PtaB.Bin104]|nr:MAG: hypothetical protein A4E53_01500 [Pelotomaculum sp. PtaB.Bin104]